MSDPRRESAVSNLRIIDLENVERAEGVQLLPVIRKRRNPHQRLDGPSLRMHLQCTRGSCPDLHQAENTCANCAKQHPQLNVKDT
eukprot:5606313-Pleurochrysis_carterae.AAC.1